MLRLAFDFIITWRETRTRPNAYKFSANATVVPNPITNATATKDFFIILYF